MHEQERSTQLELVEPRRERVQVPERGRRHADTREPVHFRPGRKRNDPPGSRLRELEDAPFVRPDQLLVLDAERRLQGDDGHVDLPPVEEREPSAQAVRAEVDLCCAFARELEHPARQARRVPSPRKHLQKRLRPEMLMEVDRRHGRSGQTPGV
jgi:hypothetical protein